MARLGAYYASPRITSKVGGKLIEYRNLEFAGNAIIKREDVKGFSQLSVLTRITEPQNALASMVIYGIKDNGLTTELQRIDQVSSTWTSCDQQISYSAIEIRMEAQSVPSATSQTSQITLERGGEESKEAASPKKTPAGKGESPEKITRGQEDVVKLKENPPPTEKTDLLIFLRPK